MKKYFILFILTISFIYGHSGRTDSSGGHNCSAKSKSKGLCTGYHYHNKKSTNSTINVKTNQTSNNDFKEIQRLLNIEGFYSGKIDGIIGPKTRNAINLYKKNNSNQNNELNNLLKKNGYM